MSGLAGIRRAIITLINAPWLVWLLLSWQAFPLIRDLFEDNRYYAEIMHLTGVLSTQLLVLTLAITPFAHITRQFGIGQSVALWLMKRRRYFGVAAFGYALLHLIFYIRETASLWVVYLEAFDLAFLFGWIGFLFLLIPFLTSNDQSIRWLGRRWKRLQQLTYIATVGLFIHWFYFDFFWDEVILWLSILTVIKLIHLFYRVARPHRKVQAS